MPTYLLTSPDGKKYRVSGEGSSEDALAHLQSQLSQPSQASSEQRYAAEDAAMEKANQDANPLSQFWTGAKTQAGRTILGAQELGLNAAESLGLERNQNYREVLAEAQKEADRRDKGTGVAGAIGNIAGDVTTFIPVGKAAKLSGEGAKLTLKQAAKEGAKIGAKTGIVSGLLQNTQDADSTLSSNVKNAAIGGVAGAALGAVAPVAAYGAKTTGKAIGGGVNRIGAALGSDVAAEKVAYSNIAKALEGQGYQPGEVQAVIDEFKAQGINGGTLGQILESSDLLAREKNLIQSGGEAGKLMTDNLKRQPKEIADSVINKVKQYLQPEQTSYLYNQAANLADTPSAKGQGRFWGMGQSAYAKEVPFTLNTISDDVDKLLSTSEGGLSSALKEIKNIIGTAVKKGNFIDADAAKQRLDDMYVENPSTWEQKKVNDLVSGYRKMLNDSLEEAGGDVYRSAKTSAKRDMAMGDVVEAFEKSQGQSVKTALNKFFGSIEKQNEFLAKLPDDGAREEFLQYVSNLEKVSGRFGGSDTASNQATQKLMNAETGLGFDANVLNPQNLVDKISAPFTRTIRKAQAKASLSPEGEKISDAMRNRQTSVKAPVLAPAVAGQQATQPNPQQEIEPQAPAHSNYIDKLIKIESNGNPNAKAKTSSAEGLAQFTDGTWRAMVSKYGQEYGLTSDGRKDPEQAKIAAQLYAEENASKLAQSLGREPEPHELYLAHFMGGGGAKKLLTLPDNANAAQVFPSAAKANKSIFIRNGQPRTVGEVKELIKRKYEDA